MIQAGQTGLGSTRSVPGQPWRWRRREPRDRALSQPAMRQRALSFFPEGTKLVANTGVRFPCPTCGVYVGYMTAWMDGSWRCHRCLPIQLSQVDLSLAAAFGALRLGVTGHISRMRMQRLSRLRFTPHTYLELAQRLSLEFADSARRLSWHARRERRLSGLSGPLGPLADACAPVYMQVVWDNAVCPAAFKHRWINYLQKPA